MEGRTSGPVVAFAVLCLFVSRGGGRQYQKFSQEPESVQVVEGQDVFLACAIDHQHGKAQWTKDGFALGFDRDVPGYPRYSYAGDPELGEHHLVISGATLTEDGEYQCQVGPTATDPPIWAAANVTVLLPPQSIAIVGWGDGAVVEVVSGTSLTLECLVSDARPAPSISWYKGGALIDPYEQMDDLETSTLPRRWSRRSQLVVTTQPEDDGKLYTCQAVHPTLNDDPTSLVASITFSVLHQPSEPIISGYEPGEVLLSGERRTLTCVVVGGNPSPWVLWYRNGQLVDDTSTTEGSQVINTHEIAITPAEDGSIYECSVTNDLMDHSFRANFTLTVYYPPNSVIISGPSQVHVGEPLSATCETSDSHPPASLTWTIDGDVVDTTKSVVGKDNTGGWVTSSDLTDYHIRSYNATEVVVECRAVNPAVDEVVKKTKIVTIIRPPGKPVFTNNLKEEVISGTILDISCISVGGHPPPSIRITKGGVEVVSEVVQEGNQTRARSEVEIAAQDNGAIITCKVTNPASTTPLVTSTELKVLFPPWEVRGWSQPATVEEDETVTLECEAATSKPPSNITWTSGQALLDDVSISTAIAAYGGTSTRSELTLTATAEDNGRVFTCEANNGLGSSVSKKLTLNVLHSPVFLVRPPVEIVVYEGADVVITATAKANPGPLRYWWRREQETLVATGGELHLGHVTRTHSGNYSVNAYNPRGAVNASFYLDVQYGPENVQSPERVTVGEGGAATVECSATGNPTPTLTWTRQQQHNGSSETLSSSIGVARLVFSSASWSDTGIYVCSASNVIASSPPIKTKIIVTQAATVVQEAGGISGAWSPVGGRGRLVCRVRAAPAPTFIWTTPDGANLSHDPDKYLLHDPQLVDGLVLWASVLEVQKVTRLDYRPYHCAAHNALGADTAILALNPPARPHPPLNFTVTNITSSSITLVWTPNFDGGLPRGYTIRYQETDGSLDYRFVDISGRNTAGTMVSGLTPGTDYLYSIKARNDQGHSDYISPPLLVSTLGRRDGSSNLVEGGAGVSRLPRLILLIMSLTGATLLILNIAIIACFVRRRTSSKPTSNASSTKPEISDVYGNSKDQECKTTADEVVLSLTTIPSSNNTPSRAKKIHQTTVDNGERTSFANGTKTERNTHLTLMQNGSVVRRGSNSSCTRNGSILRKNSFNAPQNGQSLIHNGAIPSSQSCDSKGSSPPLGSPLPDNGRVTSSRTQVRHQMSPSNPEVCSLTSTTCDIQQQRNPRSSPYPAEDQVSLASFHSNHSHTYGQGYVRPLPPLGVCPHHRQPYPTFQGQQPQTPQSPQSYTCLNPSGLYSLGSDHYDSRHQLSLPSGTPIGYATVGPRSRRTVPSLFTTLQRPCLSHAQIHGSLQPLHQCPPSCQGQCQQQQQQLGESDYNSAQHQRSSSFHGGLRFDAPFKSVKPGSTISPPQTYEQQKEIAHSEGSIPQQEFDTDWSDGSNKNKIKNKSDTRLQSDSPRGVGIHPGNTHISSSTSASLSNTLSRPRFPHDYVRQGSGKQRSSNRHGRSVASSSDVE